MVIIPRFVSAGDAACSAMSLAVKNGGRRSMCPKQRCSMAT